MSDTITTARLPREISNKLHILSRIKGKTKSDIIKESIEMYYAQEENEIDSYTLGEPYFGKYAFGDGDLSTTYKERVREIIAKKYSRSDNPETEISGC